MARSALPFPPIAGSGPRGSHSLGARRVFAHRSAAAGGPSRLHLCRLAAVAALLVWGSTGCQRKAAEAPPAPPPVIPVSHPVERAVTDFVDYTGRTDAVQSVSVRARVTGQLIRMPFEEGEDVNEGDLLFEIDRRPYQALVDQAQSQVVLAQAQLKLAKTVYARDTSLGASAAVSQLQIDQDRAAVEEAEARIGVAQAALDNARLNLDFTLVRAPLNGRISRYYYTRGNLVTQDQTLLTTIVSLEPMYVYFDIDDRTFQRIVRAAGGGKSRPTFRRPPGVALLAVAGAATWPAGVSPVTKSNMPVFIALEGEDGYPHRGTLNFINNQINPSTGTVAARAVVANARGPGGLWSLIPGMFVRVRLPLGESHTARLVVDRAIGSDQGLKFVYVVDAENKVQYRRVTTGALQEDGLRVIDAFDPATGTGLKPDDRVVVGGLQQLRPRMEIKPDQTEMPTLAGGEDSSRRKPQPPAPGEKPAGGKGPGGKAGGKT
ncbi:MAG: efflux transporter periplasmic adaptor subunit [Gemmataceae bacterium]|nr:efflux transporter periplasmic adaptor subunit [Gemmataceae bacterium]